MAPFLIHVKPSFLLLQILHLSETQPNINREIDAAAPQGMQQNGRSNPDNEIEIGTPSNYFTTVACHLPFGVALFVAKSPTTH